MDNIYAARTAFNGKSAIQVREATAAQHAEWKQSRDQAISDGEIDPDAGNDPDGWNVIYPALFQPLHRGRTRPARRALVFRSTHESFTE